MNPFGLILICALVAAGAGGALAQPAGQSLDPRLARAGVPITPAAESVGPHIVLPLRYVQAETPPLPGFAKTAIDHRFAAGEQARVTGSVGYLCGLRPSPNETNGPVSSYEPVGTFLGAKVSYAF